MSVEVFLEACRIDPDDLQLSPEILSDLGAAYELAHRGRAGHHGGELSHAVTLLTGALSQIPRFRSSHLPFGFGGAHQKGREWVDEDRIQLMMSQAIGLCQADWHAQKVNVEAMCAISDAASLGFLEKRDYDGWVPGMPSGTGRRTAISATAYGLVRARQAAATPPKAPASAWRETSPTAPTRAPSTSLPALAPEPVLVETGSNIELLTTSPLLLVAPAKQSAHWAQHEPGHSEDRYAWARQIELVRASNQVLGEEAGLNAGVLCRACKNGEITTNQKPGRASMVEVKSFLAWLGKSRDLAKEELDQVRNAIIGEISARI